MRVISVPDSEMPDGYGWLLVKGKRCAGVVAFVRESAGPDLLLEVAEAAWGLARTA
jgi:hypothetical protein